MSEVKEPQKAGKAAEEAAKAAAEKAAKAAAEKATEASEAAGAEPKAGSEQKAKQAEKQAEKPENKVEKLKAQLAEAEKKAKAAGEAAAAERDKYLHLAAEYDNFRKRSQKERQGLYSEAFADAIAAFLPTIDCVELAARCAVGDGKTAPKGELAKGVLMLEKQLKETLSKMGVEEISPAGEVFDPNFHNAVAHEEDENSPENTVTETLQKGYRIGEKVIRHAIVKVVN